MAYNIQMPRFGAASGAAPKSDWADVDNLDVEMLAEYLLDDLNNFSGGVTFDFSMDAATTPQDSTMVSPENSEDGNFPPLGEITQAPGASTAQLQQPYVNQLLTGAQLAQAGAALAAAVAPQVQALAAMPYQQQPGVVAVPPKRRRVEDTAINAAIMYNGQQLTAAAQAMQDHQGRGRKKSQAQVDRRRERNRILARRTRLRKKFFFESLQKEIMELQRENESLKDLVSRNIEGEAGKKILDECNAAEQLPPSVLEACSENQGEISAQDFNLVNSIQKSQHSFIITDPSLPDNPIVFASDDFLQVTGYSREQVLGRNCRFLQGTDTRKEDIEAIRKGLASGEDVSITLLNYTAEGKPFWNKLFIAALRDAQNNVVNFIGVTVRVVTPAPGHPDHGKRLTLHEQDDDDDEEDDDDANP